MQNDDTALVFSKDKGLHIRKARDTLPAYTFFLVSFGKKKPSKVLLEHLPCNTSESQVL
jgi:hypothetical protein